MPAARSRAALSQMIDISEDELDQSVQTAFDQTMDSSLENVNPAPATRIKASKKSKPEKAPSTKMAATSKVGKARVTTRRTSGEAVARRTVKGSKRSALAERDAPNGDETEEVDEFADAAPVARRGAKQQIADETMEDESIVDTKPVKKERARTAKTATSNPKASRRAAPDTHADDEAMDLEPSVTDDATVLPAEGPHRIASRAHQRTISRERAHAAPGRRQHSVPRSRAGSVSDPERRGTHDPALRRKLGDVTKRLESLQLRYGQLKELGLRDAESNFDKLRRASEQRARDQDDVIASLKRELTVLREQGGDAKALKAKLTGAEATSQRLGAENAKLAADAKASSGALSDAQNEVKALTAKLAAAREGVKAAEEAAKAARAGVNAAKNGAQKGAAGAAPTGTGTDTAALKLKEELYSDLTGLMVRNVKKVDGEDVFDCIQTGRNGTLHFHLSVPPPHAAGAGSAEGGGYDDVEFAYTPLLDEKNDRELFQILPDYLTEEICFPRNSAARFYAKVLDSMSRKVVIEGDE